MLETYDGCEDYPDTLRFDTSSNGSMGPTTGNLNPLLAAGDAFYSEPHDPFRSSLFSSNHIDHPALIRPAVLLPDQQSTYSELSANLIYLSSLSETTNGISFGGDKFIAGQQSLEKAHTNMEDKTAKHASADFNSEFDWLSCEKPAHKLSSASGTRHSLKHVTPDAVRRTSKLKGTPPKRIPLPYGIGKTSASSPTGKKLGLACLFCRERKIACGRPLESNPDQTCK